MITFAHMWHYYRHLIILIIGLRHSTQAPCFTAPFMPHMTLLGFMCPGPGKLIRSWALSHCAINRPPDTSLFSHSPSPDQLPLLCTSFSFASYHAVYGAHTTMSTPTIAFILISPIHTDKKGTNKIHPTWHISLCALASCSHSHFTPCSHFALHLHVTLCSHLTPRTMLILALAPCLPLHSPISLFHSFSPIITNTPITLHTPACSLISTLAPCLHSLALCAHT